MVIGKIFSMGNLFRNCKFYIILWAGQDFFFMLLLLRLLKNWWRLISIISALSLALLLNIEIELHLWFLIGVENFFLFCKELGDLVLKAMLNIWIFIPWLIPAFPFIIKRHNRIVIYLWGFVFLLCGLFKKDFIIQSEYFLVVLIVLWLILLFCFPFPALLGWWYFNISRWGSCLNWSAS